MKIIDLFNKIANGEEVPKKIKYAGYIFISKKDNYNEITYYEEQEGRNLFLSILNSTVALNETVEIIEEQQDIDIQGLAEIPGLIHALSSDGIGENIDILVNQCNYLVQAVKQLDNKLKER